MGGCRHCGFEYDLRTNVCPQCAGLHKESKSKQDLDQPGTPEADALNLGGSEEQEEPGLPEIDREGSILLQIKLYYFVRRD